MIFGFNSRIMKIIIAPLEKKRHILCIDELATG